jgi:hypothetical protein
MGRSFATLRRSWIGRLFSGLALQFLCSDGTWSFRNGEVVCSASTLRHREAFLQIGASVSFPLFGRGYISDLAQTMLA